MTQRPELTRADRGPAAEPARRLAGSSGPASSGGAWRSWPGDAPSSAELSTASFPSQAAEWLDEPSRRDFLRLMGGLAGPGRRRAAAPYQPAETIVPYVEAPERSSRASRCSSPRRCPLDGFACGVLVESQMGRPTKIEGNPTTPPAWARPTPSPRRRCSALYDPDRSQVVTHDGRINTWEHFQTLALEHPRAAARKTRAPGCAS